MKPIKTTNCKCETCETPLFRKPSQLLINKGRAFCNKKCYGIYCRSPEMVCVVCQATFKVGGGKRKRLTCSRACSNKSRKGISYKKGAPNSNSTKVRKLKGLLLEDRGHKCEMCSFNNVNILQVHHIIERSNGGSNDLENLQLLCPNCHCTIHYGDSRNTEK